MLIFNFCYNLQMTNAFFPSIFLSKKNWGLYQKRGGKSCLKKPASFFVKFVEKLFQNKCLKLYGAAQCTFKRCYQFQ